MILLDQGLSHSLNKLLVTGNIKIKFAIILIPKVACEFPYSSTMLILHVFDSLLLGKGKQLCSAMLACFFLG